MRDSFPGCPENPRAPKYSYTPRRKAKPLAAKSSWLGANGRQMEAATAIAALSAVKLSMFNGPL